jgi:biopolymer transport protein ExbD
MDQALIPLINVVFLMLIFFMVVGRLAPSSLFVVEPPSAQVGEAADANDWVVLVSAEGQLARSGQPLALDQLMAQLESAGATGTFPDLTLKADAALEAGTLREILQSLRAVNLKQVRLTTIPSN